MTYRRLLRTTHSRRTFLAGTIGLSLLVACGESEQESTPVSVGQFSRPDMLMTAQELQQRHAGNDIRIVALMPRGDYENGHIEGSAQIDWPDLKVIDTSDESIQSWQDDMAQIVGELGISMTDSVVIYDDGTRFATRLWWILHHLGHEDIRVLNGGAAAWEEADGDVTSEESPPPQTTFDIDPDPAVLAQREEVLAMLDDPNVVIIDVRTEDEYEDGHIPGAIHIPHTRNVQDGSPRYWRSQDELRQLYEEAGATPDKIIIPYCTTGVFSSITYFTLRLIGYDNVALYTGSWAEWSSHPDSPIESQMQSSRRRLRAAHRSTR